LLEAEVKESGIEKMVTSVQEKYKGVLGPFKIQKFWLEMQDELAKHFKIDFSVRVSMQILLYFCKMEEQHSFIESY
jgi:hypothetical protein